LMTGQRVYGGQPLALVPHEVAVNNLRPDWPEGLPRNQGYKQLQQLVEECWVAGPARRPTLASVFYCLEGLSQGGQSKQKQQQQVQQQQEQQGQQQEGQQQQQPVAWAGRGAHDSSWSEVLS